VDDEDPDAVINCHLQSDVDEEDSLCLLDGVTTLFDERRGSKSGDFSDAEERSVDLLLNNKAEDKTGTHWPKHSRQKPLGNGREVVKNRRGCSWRRLGVVRSLQILWKLSSLMTYTNKTAHSDTIVYYLFQVGRFTRVGLRDVS